MRTSLFLLALFTALFSQAQYKWSNPQPSGYLNNKVLFVNADSGFIINRNGDVIGTSDRGAHWNVIQNIPTAYTMDYLDSTAIIGGFQFVYVANGPSLSFIKRSLPYPEIVNHIDIVSRDTIFIVTTNLGILSTHFFKSVDRGLTWQEITTSFVMKSIDFVDSRIGYAASHAGIYKTTDGGLNWQLVNNTANFHLVKFRNKNLGFAFSETGTSRTDDGGTTWSWVAGNPTAGQIMTEVFFVDDFTAYASGEDGAVIKTTNKGVSWQNSFFGPQDTYGLYSVFFTDPNTGYTVGNRGRILKTTDAGATWKQYAPTYIDVQAIDFATDSIGYFATWNNIYKTTDAGQNWLPLSFTSSSTFQHLHFFNKDTGIAINETPLKLFKTFNGGASWTPLDLGSLYNDNFLGISYISNTIYLTTNGAYGRKVLKSEDGGITWRIQNTDFNLSYKNPVFTDEKTGYSGYGYNIYKTVDSGKTWNSILFEGQGLLNRLWFVDPATGYAVGEQSYIAMTSDSGHTWQQLAVHPDNNNLPGNITDIRFFNKKLGFLISGQNIYRTVTAGKSWQLTDIAVWNLRQIEMTNDSNAYFSGVYGTVLKKNMVQYDIDSLGLDSVTACGARIFASFTAVLSNIDSIWLQYGIGNYSSQVQAIPFSVNDTVRKIIVRLSGLTPNANMKARFRIYYKGNYYYSDSVVFHTSTLNAPNISISNGVLSSSYGQGNQWFLNGTPIAGATFSSYAPTQTGNYTVQVTIDGCPSPLSAPYNFIVTAITGPVLPDGIKVYPNPVETLLFIDNPAIRKLHITIYSPEGLLVSETESSKRKIEINMRGLPAGMYIIRLTGKNHAPAGQAMILKHN